MTSKYRIATKDGKYTIQERKFLFWDFFEYGINEGGGRYIIIENTPEKALEKFKTALNDRKYQNLLTNSGWKEL